jgi:hypothetical protein
MGVRSRVVAPGAWAEVPSEMEVVPSEMEAVRLGMAEAPLETAAEEALETVSR